MPTIAEILATPCERCGCKEKVWRECWNCDGEGEISATWDDAMVDEYHQCSHCRGRGGYRLCAKCAPPETDPRDDDEDCP